ncbi:head-tail connector protein [Algirhabdus cladophorae]|uniref:head-tail connector protein n=1 Tax=Algirhabdus cladophorae TaxID=3377108 RepID=UPI003B84518A
MILVEETAVATAALPVVQFKEHLRLGTGFSDDAVQDAVLESFLRAAIAAVEARTGKMLLSRIFTWSLTDWRHAARQALPVAPVVQIQAVILKDRFDEATPVDAARYSLAQDAHRPVLEAVGSCLPVVPPHGGVDIQFEAGYGTVWADVPADLAQAVLLLAAHYYQYRAETGLGEGCMPFGVSALLQRYRPVRVGLRAS